MIYPSIEQLTKKQYNRYTLVIATAKAARIITDQLNEERIEAEGREQQIQPLAPDEERQRISFTQGSSDEKPVVTAINMIHDGEVKIVPHAMGDARIKTQA